VHNQEVSKVKKLCYLLTILFILQLAVIGAWAAKKDCGVPPNVPAKPAIEVKKEDPNVNNDYDKAVKELTGPGVIYLTVINGSQPKANACGLNPSNPAAEYTAWGGPLNADNMTIGEGAGSRNDIVIGGTYFERGIGAHALGKFVYDLSGDKYVKFEGYVGMSDEKDAGLECGHGGSGVFVFFVDGKQMFKSDLLKGAEAGKNIPAVLVTFDIPPDAKTLTIEMQAGDDGNSCDHSCLGDGKLLTRAALAVEPVKKMATLWGDIKKTY
jgi:hypothetical protein